MINRFAQFSYVISSIYRNIQKIEHDEMVKLGYKGAYAQYLVAMVRQPNGITSSKLCEICDKNKAAVSRILSEMEEKGLVLRDHSYNALITLTKKGENLAHYVCEKAELAVNEVSKELNSEQRRLLYSTLNQITETVQRLSDGGLPPIKFNIEGE